MMKDIATFCGKTLEIANYKKKSYMKKKKFNETEKTVKEKEEATKIV